VASVDSVVTVVLEDEAVVAVFLEVEAVDLVMAAAMVLEDGVVDLVMAAAMALEDEAVAEDLLVVSKRQQQHHNRICVPKNVCVCVVLMLLGRHHNIIPFQFIFVQTLGSQHCRIDSHISRMSQFLSMYASLKKSVSVL
jgi:hypothetical protein